MDCMDCIFANIAISCCRESLLFNSEKKCEALGMSYSGRIATQRFPDVNRGGQKVMLIVSVLLLLDSTLYPQNTIRPL